MSRRNSGYFVSHPVFEILCRSDGVLYKLWLMNVRRQSYHRWHRCGASSDTDIHGLGKVSVSAGDGISVISGSENTVR